VHGDLKRASTYLVKGGPAALAPLSMTHIDFKMNTKCDSPKSFGRCIEASARMIESIGTTIKDFRAFLLVK